MENRRWDWVGIKGARAPSTKEDQRDRDPNRGEMVKGKEKAPERKPFSVESEIRWNLRDTNTT